MAIEIQKFPLEANDINSDESIRHLQQIQNLPLKRDIVEHLLKHTKVIIEKELRLAGQHEEDSVKPFIYFNQVTVNVAFRVYYQLLNKYDLEDQYFQQYVHGDNAKNFTILYFILLTAQDQHLEPETLKDKCLKAFVKAVDKNDSSLLEILKTLNLIFKKWPYLDVGHYLSLDHVYFCLQSNQLGMRDEMLTLMQHVCLCREKALEYFIRIVNFWPWTYRNKLYMLACILSKHSLEEFLNKSEYSGREFFKGLRSALSYKNLLASSQHVVKVLSSQRSEALLHMCTEILSNGSMQEIRNLYVQWFSRIQQKEELFHMVWESLNMAYIFDKAIFIHPDSVESYRIVLLCTMFSKEIFQLSATNYSKMSDNLLKNCFRYELETQLIIFKFIVDNLSNLALEDCMAFFTDFSRKHMTVENSQFRNTMLGKMPVIINHVAKMLCKLSAENNHHSSLQSNIVIFFRNMQNDIENGIGSSVYQPKIFCLKLLEILMRSLYGETVTKNSKNCSITQNQNLAEFLKQHKIFDSAQVSRRLMSLLNDPTGFDDALTLTVTLIGMSNPKDEIIINQALELAVKSCSLSVVDESNLSCLYARVAVQNCSDGTTILKLFKDILTEVKTRLCSFEKDPLFACKSKGWHLFSCLNVLNEVVQRKPELLLLESFVVLLQTIEEIEGVILKMLNVCNSQDPAEISAASFEDMDKSLEILVARSEYPSENHELSRKYLLMSFWLTLKACCDLSASMGQFVLSSNQIMDLRLEFLKRCLQISVTVLTKCRHKGAIEAAGVTIGRLTKCITAHLPEESQEYQLLHGFLLQLYDASGKREVSTTRRGAGFSIMFLHIVKNEDHRSRPILRKAIQNLLLPPKTENGVRNTAVNCDREEALHLHYLCVLVRDTELREATSKYYNEIMMAAIKHIDNTEWTVRNAALQLLGALVPKIVGQRQATEFEESLLWEPAEVSFCEVTRKLGMCYEYILNYCLAEKSATGSIILFLEFLHKVEYFHKDNITAPPSVQEFRQLMWCLLRHPSEKVRKLSSICFVRSHEFSHELPNALNEIAKILFSVKNENFFDGLVQTLHQGILKLQHDLKYVIPEEEQHTILQVIKGNLGRNFCLKRRYNFYTLCKLWDLFQLLTFDEDPTFSPIMGELRDMTLMPNDCSMGYDLWLQRVSEKDVRKMSYKDGLKI